MTHLDASVRLNLDNLEKEVVVLTKSLESAQKQLENTSDDVKEQMAAFLEVSASLAGRSLP
jgi:hypothetical protein